MKIRSNPFPLLVLALAASAPLSHAAPSMEDMEARLAELQTRMTEMHLQMTSLQAELATLKEREASAPTPVSPASPPQPSPTVTAPPTPNVSSKFPLRFYGKVKFDAIYDSNHFGSDEYILYIPQKADGDAQATFTARETRLGVAIEGPVFNDWKTAAKVETDFYGSAPSSGSGSLRIRLAYVDLSNGRTSVRVGQDWLPIATANPATTNFTILGYNGNLWGRIPQITATQEFNERFEGYVSTFRCRDEEDIEHGLSCDLVMPWVAAGFRFQGRLLDENKTATLALGGAFRQGDVEGRSVTPELFSAEFSVPWNALALNGEIYSGKGIGAEFLHRNGAFNLRGEPIRTQGGFLQLGLQASAAVRLHVGYGMDNPDDDDLVADEFFRKCTSLFGNAVYAFTPELSVILEGTLVETTWSDGPEDGYRVQSSLVFVW